MNAKKRNPKYVPLDWFIDSEQMFFTLHHHIIKIDHKQHKQKSIAAITITRASTVSTMKEFEAVKDKR